MRAVVTLTLHQLEPIVRRGRIVGTASAEQRTVSNAFEGIDQRDCARQAVAFVTDTLPDFTVTHTEIRRIVK